MIQEEQSRTNPKPRKPAISFFREPFLISHYSAEDLWMSSTGLLLIRETKGFSAVPLSENNRIQDRKWRLKKQMHHIGDIQA
jgi:hypothetical protein